MDNKVCIPHDCGMIMLGGDEIFRMGSPSGKSATMR